MRIIYLLSFLLLLTVSVVAQPVNDECTTAVHLPNTNSWCSEPAAYSNLNATPFGGPTPGNNCFLPYQNDVWFTFIPQTPAIYIKISGQINNLGTLRNPAIAVFDGPCSNLTRIGCNLTSSLTNQIELSLSDLVIGKVYFLLVEGQGNSTGTFQICIEGFIQPPSP